MMLAPIISTASDLGETERYDHLNLAIMFLLRTYYSDIFLTQAAPQINIESWRSQSKLGNDTKYVGSSCQTFFEPSGLETNRRVLQGPKENSRCLRNGRHRRNPFRRWLHRETRRRQPLPRIPAHSTAGAHIPTLITQTHTSPRSSPPLPPPAARTD
jgi:hypothetical protein